MIEYTDVFAYILAEKNNWRTARVPLTNSKDWNMYEHIQRCKNVANAWYHQGKNDGLRPYDDIVTPIIDVAFRSEGFNVADIVPFVNDAKYYYLSFLVKKYHPQWARKNELDTFIDEVVENSVIFDLVLVKDIKNVRPEVVDLTTIAFCDQTDVIAGPICLQHDYTIADLLAFKGKWDDEAIDMAITMATEERKMPLANDQVLKTPGTYIQAFELRGNLPAKWLDEGGEKYDHADQMHIVCFYTDKSGKKSGITLYKGKDRPLKDNFKALKIDTVRSKGRACGRSIVERLFEPQVANNYGAIKKKGLMDSAINVFVTDSDEIANKKLSDLKNNTILKQSKGDTTVRLDGALQNLVAFDNHQIGQENRARTLGSASEASLGKNPTAGTPFALQSLIVQEGQGIHEYRQGKVATFFSDVLYPDLILPYLVKDMNGGKKFSEDLSLDELNEIAETVASNAAEREIMGMILDDKIPTPEVREELIRIKKEEFKKGGTRRFMEVLQGELKDLPLQVLINIKGKQHKMVENADKITNLIREIVANLAAFQQNPGLAKPLNELLEESGMSPIDFSQIIAPEEQPLPITT